LCVVLAPDEPGVSATLTRRLSLHPGDANFLDGAIWRARMWAGDEEGEIRRRDPIVVERVDGLALTVRDAEEWEVAP
jgi:hypothetical protein